MEAICFWNKIARAIYSSSTSQITDLFCRIFGQIWSAAANLISKLRKNVFQLNWEIHQKYHSYKSDFKIWHFVCISGYQATARIWTDIRHALLNNPACKNIWQNTNSDQINWVLLDQSRPILIGTLILSNLFTINLDTLHFNKALTLNSHTNIHIFRHSGQLQDI